MSVSDEATTEMAAADDGFELSFRSRRDRRCSQCESVALVYDTESRGPRCRACGELDSGFSRQ